MANERRERKKSNVNSYIHYEMITLNFISFLITKTNTTLCCHTPSSKQTHMHKFSFSFISMFHLSFCVDLHVLVFHFPQKRQWFNEILPFFIKCECKLRRKSIQNYFMNFLLDFHSCCSWCCWCCYCSCCNGVFIFNNCVVFLMFGGTVARRHLIQTFAQFTLPTTTLSAMRHYSCMRFHYAISSHSLILFVRVIVYENAECVVRTRILNLIQSRCLFSFAKCVCRSAWCGGS